jgi:hypothetical protein
MSTPFYRDLVVEIRGERTAVYTGGHLRCTTPKPVDILVLRAIGFEVTVIESAEGAERLSLTKTEPNRSCALQSGK